MMSLKQLIPKLRVYLTGIFIFFLAYNYSLTIQIGFPLKISEIALFLLLAISAPSLVEEWNNARKNRSILILAGLFLLFAVSAGVNTFWTYPYQLDIYNSRFDYKLDGLLKLGYIFLSISAAYFTSTAFKDNKKLFLSLYIWGAVSAAIYAWYLFSFSLLRIPYYTLPGSEVHPQAALFQFGHFIRCGTFKEGNYMGMFLVSSAVIAFYAKRYIIAGFLFLSIITTASSMAAVTTCLFIVSYFSIYLLKKRKHFLLMSFFSAFLLLIIFLLQFEDVRYMAAKVVPMDGVEYKDAVHSQSERINLSKVALKIGADNPFFGVGLTNFSWHYLHYNENPVFMPRVEKILVNNVYMEIFAEGGIIILLLFLFFLWTLFKKSLLDNTGTLTLGLLITLIYWLAFPTFTVLFTWVFFGLLMSVNKEAKKAEVLSPLPNEAPGI